MTPKLRPLTREAISRIDDLRRASAELARDLGQPSEPSTTEELDELWVRWLDSKPADDDAPWVISAIGVRFGDSLVEAFGWQWSVAERDGRNDIVVHDGKGGWMVWPRDVVGKRYVSRETGFMTALRDELAAQR